MYRNRCEEYTVSTDLIGDEKMYIDYTYIMYVLPAVFFAMWASSKVNSTFRKYSSQYSMRNMTGRDAARAVLDANGLYQVRIERVAGNLTDHYDPRNNVIRLRSEEHTSELRH